MQEIAEQVKNTWACSERADLHNRNNLTPAFVLGNSLSVLLKGTCAFQNRLIKIRLCFHQAVCVNSSVLRLFLEYDKNHLSYVHVWLLLLHHLTRRASSITLFKGSLEQKPHIQFIYFLLKPQPWVSAILTCTLSHVSAFYRCFPSASIIPYVSLILPNCRIVCPFKTFSLSCMFFWRRCFSLKEI